MGSQAEGRGTAGVPRGVWLTAVLVVAGLVVVAGRYGFHRDEFYFIEGGRHPGWAQPDNPMLIPLLAASWHDLVGGQLWAFRLLPALATGVTVVLTALTCRHLGGAPRAQVVAAAGTALTGVVLGTGHLFSITTFDVTMTALVVLLLVRAVGAAPQRIGPWLWTGLAAGVALEVKVLPGLVLLSCLVGMLLAGPRRPLRGPGPWLAGALALVLAAPNLLWQAAHGWPMLEVAANIAAGGSASSADRWLVVPMHLLMAGPVAGFLIVVGVVALLTSAGLRAWRWLGIAYLVLLLLVVVTGGKPYYLAGLFPALVAVGATALPAWVERLLDRPARAVTVALVVSVPTACFALPLAPVGSPVFRIAQAVNPDGAETVGWPGYVGQVTDVAAQVPDDERPHTVVLTRNYGEAGALDRARRLASGGTSGDGAPGWLPPVYSGHNAYGSWGPPPEDARTVIVVGRLDPDEEARWFAGTCQQVTTVRSPAGVDNEEDGAPIRRCQLGDQGWVAIWDEVARFG